LALEPWTLLWDLGAIDIASLSGFEPDGTPTPNESDFHEPLGRRKKERLAMMSLAVFASLLILYNLVSRGREQTRHWNRIEVQETGLSRAKIYE
jgi:hypothetical protein